jgi:hypothetical protein
MMSPKGGLELLLSNISTSRQGGQIVGPPDACRSLQLLFNGV